MFLKNLKTLPYEYMVIAIGNVNFRERFSREIFERDFRERFYTTFIFMGYSYVFCARIPEWSKGSDLRSDALCFVGSNPTSCIFLLC